MQEVYLLICAIGFVVYIFATKDIPYIPLRKREKPLTSKREIINWYAWRGPMFIEDFHDSCSDSHNNTGHNDSQKKNNCVEFVGPILSDNPTNLPSDSIECCQENEIKRQKHLQDFKSCNRIAMKMSRTPSCAETAQHSWENKQFNCSYVMRGPDPITGDLGNYTQCTNNNLDTPNQLKCVGLGVIDSEVCPTEHLVSPYYYNKVLNKCMQDKGHLKCALGHLKKDCQV